MQFDVVCEPVVLGRRMFVPSMVSDSVSAINIHTGDELWRFHAQGPVRLAPVAWRDRVFFASDDGHLYCVNAKDGKLIWKHRGLPDGRQDRKILGNDRLISLWPARGGPVLADGAVYYAAGLWPANGIFIYALDANSGKEIWRNEDSDFIPRLLKDHARSFNAGFAPQGYLTVLGDHLVVPNGHAMPGILDRRTGKRRQLPSFWGGRAGLAKGSWMTTGRDSLLFSGGDVFDLTLLVGNSRNESRLMMDPANLKDWGPHRVPVIGPDAIYASTPRLTVDLHPQVGKPSSRTVSDGISGIEAWDLNPLRNDVKQEPARRIARNGEAPHDEKSTAPIQEQNPLDAKLKKQVATRLRQRWSIESDLLIHLKSGSRLYGSSDGYVAALDLSLSGVSPKETWRAKLQGTVVSMLSASGMLFVVTSDGAIHAFGAEVPNREPKLVGHEKSDPEILPKRYCIALGAGSFEHAQKTDSRIILVDDDPQTVGRLRKDLDASSTTRARVSVHHGDPLSCPLPPWIGSVIVADQRTTLRIASDLQSLPRVIRRLNPYHGELWLEADERDHDALVESLADVNISGLTTRRDEIWTKISCRGGVPQSGDWTHINGDASSARVIQEGSVQGPLEMLWFGGGIDANLLPEWDFTHARLAPPLVCNGRMFVQFPPEIHAVDIYTGIPQWSMQFDKVELETGGNKDPGLYFRPRSFISAVSEDRLYIVTTPNTVSVAEVVEPADSNRLIAVDPATGNVLYELNSPKGEHWRDVKSEGNQLILSTSQRVLSLDPSNGKKLWEHSCESEALEFVLGRGKAMILDLKSPNLQLRRRGMESNKRGHLVAVDIETGHVAWRTEISPRRHTGSVLAFSVEHDAAIVVIDQSMTRFRGSDGRQVWNSSVSEKSGAKQPVRGVVESGRFRPLLLKDQILSGDGGEAYAWKDGGQVPSPVPPGWNGRGCTQILGTTSLLTARTANATYFDLQTCKMYEILGVRVGCTNSLIPSGGVLTAPYYAQGCSCNYALPSSFALVPRQHLERIEEP